MSRRIDDLDPETARKCRLLLRACEEAGIKIVVVHTLRTYEEQALIYAQGRTRPGPIVTKAKPGYSWHNFGRAFDVAFEGTKPGTVKWTGPWEQLGQMGESLGLDWGGRWVTFVDKPHFEDKRGQTLAQLRALRG